MLLSFLVMLLILLQLTAALTLVFMIAAGVTRRRAHGRSIATELTGTTNRNFLQRRCLGQHA